jgi:DNA-binding transcriptional LysR family regulator
MPPMYSSELDLLSLKAFCLLMNARSVSRAATSLGVSQPTMSRLLSRLRHSLGDPLLIWAGGRMVPTPRALALEPEIRQIVDAMDRITRPSELFDPASSESTIVLAAAGHLETILLSSVMKRIAAEAPRVSLDIRAPHRLHDTAALERGELDFIVGWSTAPLPTLRSRLLFTDRLVCIARTGHPALHGSTMTYENFLNLSHVQFDFPGRTTTDLVIQQRLAQEGERLSVRFRVQSSQTLTEVVANTDLIAILPNRFAQRFLNQHALMVLDLPLKLPTMQNKAFWHERAHSDPRSRWFRKVLANVARTVPEAGPRGLV